MPIDTTLTEQKIQRVLGGFIASPKYRVDGLFVFGWESDKLIWTKAGYIYEFEIKISRSDYMNDFRHKVEKHLLLNSAMPDESTEVREADLFGNLLKEKRKRYPQITTEQAKNMMKSVGERMPNYFYYAVPEGLLEPDEVPPYAGLVYITTYKGSYENEPDKWRHNYKVIRKAPQLHKTKYTDGELNLGEKFYYNWLSTKQVLRQAEKDVEYYKTQLKHEIDSKGHECTYEELQHKYNSIVTSACYWKDLYLTMVEGADYNSIERRMLIAKIREYDPQFDYSAFMKEVDKRYEERYPNRK